MSAAGKRIHLDLVIASSALAALGHETRLAVFRLLVQAGEDGLQPGRIAEAIGIPASSLSFHLMHLQHAGLIASRREGRGLDLHHPLRRHGGSDGVPLRELLSR